MGGFMDALQERILKVVEDDIAEGFRIWRDFSIGMPLKMQMTRDLRKLVCILYAKQSEDGNNRADGGR
jgi:hypothetical protein